LAFASWLGLKEFTHKMKKEALDTAQRVVKEKLE